MGGLEGSSVRDGGLGVWSGTGQAAAGGAAEEQAHAPPHTLKVAPHRRRGSQRWAGLARLPRRWLPHRASCGDDSGGEGVGLRPEVRILQRGGILELAQGVLQGITGRRLVLAVAHVERDTQGGGGKWEAGHRVWDGLRVLYGMGNILWHLCGLAREYLRPFRIGQRNSRDQDNSGGVCDEGVPGGAHTAHKVCCTGALSRLGAQCGAGGCVRARGMLRRKCVCALLLQVRNIRGQEEGASLGRGCGGHLCGVRGTNRGRALLTRDAVVVFPPEDHLAVLLLRHYCVHHPPRHRRPPQREACGI
mmetsp:Transcript_31448/g.77097  ORF Transcript_31448/g.77097 Transcript_31448/m.77097 type:complete len:304 (-) Transcript_31448:1473-2384(-)